MEQLLTTKQVAEMYNISAYTITTNWCNKGLKFLRQKHTFLFKKEWVDTFIEEEAERQSFQRINKKVKTKNVTLTSVPKFNKQMKII